MSSSTSRRSEARRPRAVSRAEEEQLIESFLESSTETRMHLEILRRGLEPLQADNGHLDPPHGPARRTYQLVFLQMQAT